jgi:hypothetical protein
METKIWHPGLMDPKSSKLRVGTTNAEEFDYGTMGPGVARVHMVYRIGSKLAPKTCSLEAKLRKKIRRLHLKP